MATSHVKGRGTFEFLRGAIGVSIFFVLSGYLITSLLLKEHQTTGRVSLKAFYIRRSFRIFPLYYLVLALYCVLVLVLHKDPRITEFKTALPYYLTYLQEIPHELFFYRNGSAPFEISWSLGIEEKFYLVWPALAFVFVSAGGRRLWIALVGALACWAAILWQPYGRLLLPYCFILIGCATALYFEKPEGRSLRDRLTSPWVALVSAIAIAAVPAWGAGIVVGVATAAAIPALEAPHRGLPAFLATWPMAWLGRLSYGFYLTHQLGLNLARKLFHFGPTTSGDIGVLLVGVAVTIPACAAIHYAFERPLISLGRRIAAPRRAEIESVAAAA